MAAGGLVKRDVKDNVQVGFAKAVKVVTIFDYSVLYSLRSRICVLYYMRCTTQSIRGDEETLFEKKKNIH